MLSSPTVIVAPAAEPVSLDQAKQYLRIDGDALDGDVEMLIAAARGDLEQATGQRLVTQTVKVLADCFEDLDHLEVGPVQSVTSITYQDPQGVEEELAGESYELFGAGLERGIRLKVGASWPSHRLVSGAIAVTMVVGYGAAAAVPQNLRFAVFSLLRGRFDGKPVSIESLIVNDRVGL